MKPKASLLALMVAFPLLYVSGAILRGGAASSLALLIVGAICVFLLWPEKKA